MSDGQGDDEWRRPRSKPAGHEQGPRQHAHAPMAAPGQPTLVQALPSPSPSQALERALTSIDQNTTRLISAIAAADYRRAWYTAVDLQKSLAYAQELLDAHAGSPEQAQRLRTLRAAADPQLARAPAPSAAALREVTSSGPGMARPHWDAELRAWMARQGSRPGAPPADSSRPGRDPTVAAGAAPPDLGNYDSATGKHVHVLRTWDDAAIAARRVELQGRLSWTTAPQPRDELLREYEAIEWVAHERHLPLPQDPGEAAAPRAFVGGQPTKAWLPATSQGMRAMLEREMAAGTGYAAARTHAQLRIDYATTSRSTTANDQWQIGRQQTALLDHDAAAFRAAFQTEARHTALAMLDASTLAIDTALRSYGIAGGSFRLTDAAHKVARAPDALDAEVDRWVMLSSHLDRNRAAFAAGHGNREDLARQAQQLRTLQDNVTTLAAEQLRLMQLVQRQHPEPPGIPRAARTEDRQLDPLVRRPVPLQGSAQNPFDQLRAPSAGPPEQQLAFVRGALQARQAQFRAAWIQAERAHPVLAAYRGRKEPDASTLAPMGSDEATTRSVITQVLPKLAHIHRTRAALVGAWGTLDPLQFAPVVELTRQRMFVPAGSYRDRAVHDMVAHAHDQHGGLAPWALEAVMLGLTLLTLVPTAGTSAAAGLALTGLAYDLYAGLEDHEDFQRSSAAADTDLDKLRSLSDAEPSLTPLLLRIVSAGVNLATAAGLFRRAVTLRRMALEGPLEADAVAALNQAGDELGVRGVGDESVAAVGGKPAVTKGPPGEPAPSSEPHAPPAPPSQPTPTHGPHAAPPPPSQPTPTHGPHAAPPPPGQPAHHTGDTAHPGGDRAHEAGPAGSIERRPTRAPHDARERVSPEHLAHLEQQLGVPIAFDDSLASGVELHYVEKRGALGLGTDLEPTGLRIGRAALVEDVLAHRATIARVTHYNGVVGKLRRLWDRVVAETRGVNPLPAGSRGWESFEELRKIDELIELRRARWNPQVLDRRVLDDEIAFLESRRAYHEEILRTAEETGALHGAGHIDMPDVRKVTAEAQANGYQLPGTNEGANPDWYYYRNKRDLPGEYELAVKPSAPAEATSYRAVTKDGKFLRLEPGDTPRPPALLTGEWTDRQVIDHLWADDSFRAFATLLEREGLATRAEINAAIVAKSGNRTRLGSLADDTLRGNIKDAFRPRLIEKLADPALDEQASWKRMRHMLDGLDNADRGNLVELWYQRRHVASAQHRVPVHVARTGGKAGQIEVRKIDLVDGDRAIEVKDVGGPIDKDQFAAYLDMVENETQVMRPAGTTAIKKVRYVFTRPEGARANLGFFAEQLRRPRLALRLSIEAFDATGVKRTVTTAREAQDLLAELGGPL
jgi:hypothetical protein